MDVTLKNESNNRAMKKRIVFVTDHLKMGGAEKVLIEILKNINTQKYDVRLIVKNNYGTSSDVQKNNFEKNNE